jgi:hypothetical protein
MSDYALFWLRLHSELGQLAEYDEFRHLLAQMAPHRQTAPRVSSGEERSAVIYRKELRSNGKLPHSAGGGKRCSQ